MGKVASMLSFGAAACACLLLSLLVILLWSNTSHLIGNFHALRNPTEIACKNPASTPPMGTSITDPVQYVDVVRGVAPTFKDFSYGNVLPIVAMPRGMTHWAISTSTQVTNAWFVDVQSNTFAGIRFTNEPSPWMFDFAPMMFTPSVGDETPLFRFPRMDDINSNEVSPSHMDITFPNFCTHHGCAKVQFAPSHSGGMMLFKFPKGLPGVRYITQTLPYSSQVAYDADSNLVEGVIKNKHSADGARNFGLHFSISYEFVGAKPELRFSSTARHSTTPQMSWNPVSPDKEDVVLLRIGVSYIDMEQARLNAKRELGHHSSIDSLINEARDAWNEKLGRVQVPASSDIRDLRNLYTALYRTLLFPQDISEVDASGQRRSYSPYDATGRVFPGRLATNSGFWDAYRTLYPLLNLVYPEIASEVYEGWVNALKHNNGRVPEWPSPGLRTMMPGTMSDVSMSEGIINGVIHKKEDVDAVYKALKKNAFEPSRGRERLSEYAGAGYIRNKVALTLNFMLSDYAISRVARKLNDTEVAEKLEKRAYSWPKIFDKDLKFFRTPSEDGTFPKEFDPYQWKRPEGYTEAGAWQYRFYAPFDPKGLREAYSAGSDDKNLCRVLNATMHEPPVHHGELMHESVELQTNCWGQYAHSNQPSHHVLYMFAHGDCAQDGQAWIQLALKALYGDFGFAGDEDNGEMSAWYILSSMGLYALVPSSGEYQIGAPTMFGRMEISWPSRNKKLVIARDNNLPRRTVVANGRPYTFPVSDVITWNGEKTDMGTGVATIPYKNLMQGGTLRFGSSQQDHNVDQ